MQELEILRAARVRLKKYGWKRFDLGGRTSPGCATGHCAFATLAFGRPNEKTSKIYLDYSYVRGLENVDNLLGSIVGGGVINWNDNDCRDKRECLKLFDTAIEILEHH